MTNGNDPIHEVKNANGTTMVGNEETRGWIGVTNPFLGLTKREYFAAMAMQGILAGYQGKPYFMERVVSDATDLADALITTLNTNQ